MTSAFPVASTADADPSWASHTLLRPCSPFAQENVVGFGREHCRGASENVSTERALIPNPSPVAMGEGSGGTSISCESLLSLALQLAVALAVFSAVSRL